MNNMRIRVAIADDHVLFAESLAGFINSASDMHVCNISNNGNELISYLKKSRLPDVILLDIEMPEKDGFSAVKEILDIHKKAKIIVLSMHSVRSYMKRMLSAGVSGYLLKDTAGDDLLKAIRTVADGGLAYNKEALSLMKLMIADDSGFDLDGPEFSEREFKIIRYLCEEKSVSEIAELLYVSKSTIELDKKSIFSKIGVKSSAGIIVYALKNKLYYY